MQKGLIGVIVPVYNVEKYITECIDSILAQTYTDFRLILVDDGTPDNAGKICDEYSKSDSRITVIHQDNAGVTRARARGIEEAADCEWITFVDSDDTITSDALEHLLSFTNEHSNIIACPQSKYLRPGTESLSAIDYRHHVVSELNFFVAPWGKLFRRTLFDHSIFDIPKWIVVNEDMLMNVKLAFRNDSTIFICKKNIYNYRTNETGATKSTTLTPFYEQIVHKYKLRIIPIHERSQYIEETIPIRFIRWKNYYSFRYVVKDMNNCKFYNELKREMQKYQYPLSAIDRILFNCKNPLIRFIVINIKKLYNKFGS